MVRGVWFIALTLSASAASGWPEQAERAEPAPCAAMPVIERTPTAFTLRSDPYTFKIASLNMHADPRITSALAEWTRARDLDVLLLQEVGGHEVDGEAFVTDLSDRLGYHLAYAPANLMGDTEMQGLAILSREPLRDVRVYPLTYHQLRFKSRCRIALAATADTSVGPVLVTNVHLDTRINSEDRVKQLAPLLDALEELEGPQLVGGDFNTMNVYWWRTMWPIWNGDRQAAAVRTQMTERGFHTPFIDGRPTFKLMGLPIRLDWIFLKQLDADAWSVDDVPVTDHRGVWARVKPGPTASSLR